MNSDKWLVCGQKCGSNNLTNTKDPSNGEWQPKLLRVIMFSFIVNHLDLVESFYGLPEMIVEEIFTSKELSEEKKKNHMHLAIEACPELFRVLHVERNPTMADKLYNLPFSVLSGMKKLLIEGCDLSKERLLITGKEFESLTVLQLDACHLHDEDLRLLTGRQRVYKTGCLENLRALSLCCNHNLTQKCLQYFNCFTKLGKLRLCGKQRWSFTDKENLNDLSSKWTRADVANKMDNDQYGFQKENPEEDNWLIDLFYRVHQISESNESKLMKKEKRRLADTFRCNRTELNQFYGEETVKDFGAINSECSMESFQFLYRQPVLERLAEKSGAISAPLKRKREETERKNQFDLKMLKLYL